MLRIGILAVALGSAVVARAADPPTKTPRPKLSDDARTFVARCTRLMKIDYEGEVALRTRVMDMPNGTPDSQVKMILHKRGVVITKFVNGYLIPRSRNRLIAYIDKHSPEELKKMNELMALTGKHHSEEDSKRLAGIVDDIAKIEDAVLKEVPESRFPTFDK